MRVACYRLLGSVQDAEDMVQETFLRAWNGRGGFSGGQYFRAWLYKIATNVCLDALAKRARRGLSADLFPPSEPATGIAAAVSEPIWLEPFPDTRLPEAARVIELARAHGALGWKVNGAGGAGGSLTLLCGPRAEAKRALLREVAQEDASFKIIPIRLSRGGLRVWKNDY